MKWHEIDENIVKSLQDYTPYNADAEASKFKIWEAVQASQIKKDKFVWWKYAAVLLLFLALPTSLFFRYDINDNNFAEISNFKIINAENTCSKIKKTNESNHSKDIKQATVKDNFISSVKENNKKETNTILKTEILANIDTLKKDSILNYSIKEKVLLSENTIKQTAERIYIVELLKENNIDSKPKIIYNQSLNQIIAKTKSQKIKIRFGNKNKQMQTARLLEVMADL